MTKHAPRSVAIALMAMFLAALAAGCAPGPENPVVFSGATMGTTYTVRYYGSPDENLHREIAAKLDELNAKLSTYQPDSEISRFNKHQGRNWFEVSLETALLVKMSNLISKQSDGAFDITIGPLVNAWGFGPGKRVITPPAQETIDELLQHSGYQKLFARDIPPAISKDDPQLQIDLSAIAKGFAVDVVGEMLLKAGITNWLVEIGGEIRISGKKPAADGSESAWQVAIERPVAADRSVQRILALQGFQAVATSGDYRNFFEYEGQRYSHSINPQTGWPVSYEGGDEIAAVTVVSTSAMLADAWATALLVTGAEQALKLADQQKLAVNLIVRRDGELVELPNQAFEWLTAEN